MHLFDLPLEIFHVILGKTVSTLYCEELIQLQLVNSKPPKYQIPKYNILIQAQSYLPEKSLLLHALHTISAIVDAGCLLPHTISKARHSLQAQWMTILPSQCEIQPTRWWSIFLGMKIKGCTYPFLSHVQQSNSTHLEYTL